MSISEGPLTAPIPCGRCMARVRQTGVRGMALFLASVVIVVWMEASAFLTTETLALTKGEGGIETIEVDLNTSLGVRQNGHLGEGSLRTVSSSLWKSATLLIMSNSSGRTCMDCTTNCLTQRRQHRPASPPGRAQQSKSAITGFLVIHIEHRPNASLTSMQFHAISWTASCRNFRTYWEDSWVEECRLEHSRHAQGDGLEHARAAVDCRIWRTLGIR